MRNGIIVAALGVSLLGLCGCPKHGSVVPQMEPHQTYLTDLDEDGVLEYNCEAFVKTRNQIYRIVITGEMDEFVLAQGNVEIYNSTNGGFEPFLGGFEVVDGNLIYDKENHSHTSLKELVGLPDNGYGTSM